MLSRHHVADIGNVTAVFGLGAMADVAPKRDQKRKKVTTNFLLGRIHCTATNMENKPARTLPRTQPTLVNVRHDKPIWWKMMGCFSCQAEMSSSLLQRLTSPCTAHAGLISFGPPRRECCFSWRNLVLFFHGLFPYRVFAETLFFSYSQQRELRGKSNFSLTLRPRTGGKLSF